MNEKELIYTYEELEDLVLKYQELYIKEKNNINKAIEYIYANCFDETKKQCVDDLWGKEINNLLDILKGVEE